MRGSFVYVICFITLIVWGLSFTFIRPFWDIILDFAQQLVPDHGIYLIFQMFWEYLPLFVFGSMLIYTIIQSQSPD